MNPKSDQLEKMWRLKNPKTQRPQNVDVFQDLVPIASIQSVLQVAPIAVDNDTSCI